MVFVLSGGQARVILESRHACQFLASEPCSRSADPSATLRTLGAAALRMTPIRRCELRVGRPFAQCLSLRGLPPVPPMRLKELVVGGQEQLLNTRAGPMLIVASWGCLRAWVSRRSRHTARVAAIPKALVEGCHGALRQAGFTCLAVRPGVSSHRGLRWRLREPSGSGWGRALGRHAAMLLGAAVAAGVLYHARLVRADHALQESAREMAPVESTLTGLLDSVQIVQRRMGTVDSLMTARGRVQQQVAMVVLALGDSTWLTSLRIRADTIRGSAVSPGAIEAMARMATHAGMEHLLGDGSPVPYPGSGPRRESFAFTAATRP